MVTRKRGTVAGLFTAAVLFTFSSLAIAQGNESGYTSKYLANLNKSSLNKNIDNARAREEAIKERYGVEKRDAKAMFGEAHKQQNLYKNLLPGGSAPVGTPV